MQRVAMTLPHTPRRRSCHRQRPQSQRSRYAMVLPDWRPPRRPHGNRLDPWRLRAIRRLL